MLLLLYTFGIPEFDYNTVAGIVYYIEVLAMGNTYQEVIQRSVDRLNE